MTLLAHLLISVFTFLASLSAYTAPGNPSTTTTTVVASGGQKVMPRVAQTPAPARHSSTTTTAAPTTTTTTAPVVYAESGDYSAQRDEATNYKFLSDYRWGCATSITWAASPNATAEAQSEIAATFAELHGLTALSFLPTDDFTNANIQITFVGDDWRLANPGKWGHTDLFQRDGAIALAKVSVSDLLADPLLHTVIRHEFGHAMGLDHVNGNEVMAQEGADTYHAGDIAGLKIAGEACQ